MLVRIEDIKIKKRIRKDKTDIEPLADSMRVYGLLNPIVLDSDYTLIAGFRRLQAAKELGWITVPATIADVKDKIERMEIELEENIQRADFTQEDLLAGYEALHRLKNPGFVRRLAEKIKSFFIRLFGVNEERRAEKRKKNILLSLFAPGGLILAVVSGLLHKGGYISPILLSALNLAALVFVICGIIFFIRFRAGRKKKSAAEKRKADF
ncbi:ParB N-terminal domain-containing protein [Treponema sp. HNW]|uniref:ParB N-terminal domain-containing protein n=1 Tax=Treponema sp. HNW TaxID=3116654 RepID=UPI003D1243C6